MRWIDKRSAPPELTAWQAAYRATDPNYGYDLMNSTLRQTVLSALVKEQGEICAYSGVRIGIGACHIEHVIPQSHCTEANGLAGQDVDYGNLVACYPAPNTGYAPYGAIPKADWPSPNQRPLFVSPLDRNCEKRFIFRKNGIMRPANPEDAAAVETILRLKLSEEDVLKPAYQLVQQRQAAIRETLRNDSLPLADARRRLRGLEEAEQTGQKLEPYCFALKQALTAHIRRVEAIRSRRAQR